MNHLHEYNALNRLTNRNMSAQTTVTAAWIAEHLHMGTRGQRFADAGNFASYCRCVKSLRTSNGKKKGENNRKCGNKYLAWAFVEAAHFACRSDDQCRRF